MPQEHTRRRVLRMGGQLAAAGAVASSAGCLSSIPFIGGGAVAPKKWTVAPGVFGDREHGTFSYSQPKTILKDEDVLPDRVIDRMERDTWRKTVTGIDADAVAATLSAGPYEVWKADMNKGDVTDELDDNDFEDDGKHSGFNVWVAADDSDYAGSAVGVTGGKLVFGRRRGETDAQDVVETAIDVGKGDEDRYAQESDAMKVVMNKIGTGERAFGRTLEAPNETNEEEGQFEDNVGRGARWNVNGETTKIRSVYVFDDKSAADKEAVMDWVDHRKDQDESTLAEADSVNVNKSGKAIVIKVKVPTDEVYEEQ